MIQLAESVIDRYREYLRDHPDPSLQQFLIENHITADEVIAELIEVDGRTKIDQGEAIELREYLESVPDLHKHSISLDSAIDMTLRSICQSDRPSVEGIETLLSNYPDLGPQIRTAAKLGLALWSTEHISPGTRRSPIQLPANFGPKLDDDRSKFRLLSLAGSGAWAHTYLGIDQELSDADMPALVAVKVFAGEEGDSWARREFIDEATKARRVDHPNVVRVLERGTTEAGAEYIVYEYVAGGDMYELVRKRSDPLRPRVAVELVAKVARGVQAIHSSGLVHCDIKPANILITNHQEPKVTDLGIARRENSTPASDASPPPSAPMGTLGFMAPEQFHMEESATDPPADIFAIGAVLYWLITQRLPLGEDAESISKAHDEHRSVPSLLDSRMPGVDKDLASICARALSIKPETRHFSAGEVAEDLNRWLSRHPIPWTKPSPLRIVKLWMIRMPVLAGLMLISVLAVSSGAAIAWRYQIRAQAAQIRVQERLEMEAKMLRGVEATTDYYLTRPWEGQMGVNLWINWLNDWLFGPDTMGTPETLATLSRAKVIIARRHTEHMVERGLGESLERYMWDALRSIWLIDDGRLDEGEELLVEAESYFSRTLPPEDPLFWLFQTAHEGVKADRLFLTDSTRTDFDHSKAREIADRLETLLTMIHVTGDEKPMVAFIHRRLEKLYASDALDKPAMLDALDRSREPVNFVTDSE